MLKFKKVIPFVLAVIICFFPFGKDLKAFAYYGGLLNGKNVSVGSSINNVSSTTPYLTDSNGGSGIAVDTSASTQWVYYKFPTPAHIQSYYMSISVLSGVILHFYDSNQHEISSVTVGANGSVANLASPVDNVSYVAFQFTAPHTLYELDVFGSDLIRDDITSLSATPTSTSVALTWNDLSVNPDLTGYKIYRNNSFLTTISRTTNSFVDNTVQDSTKYTYKVTANYSDNVETTGMIQTVTTKAIVKSPDNVTNSKITPDWNKVNLSWTNPTNSNFSKVYIYRNGVKIGETTGESFTNSTDVKPTTAYTYKLTSVSIEGLESNGVSLTTTTTQEPPPKIVNPTFTQLPNGDVKIAWDQPTTGTMNITAAGKIYKTDASQQQYIVSAQDNLKDVFGNLNVSMQAVSPSGLKGDIVQAPKTNNPILSINANDLITSGNNLFWIISPLVLLALTFLLVPKLRKLIFSVFSKGKKTRGESSGTDQRGQRERHEGKEHIEKKNIRIREEREKRAPRQFIKAMEQDAPKEPRQKFRLERNKRAARITKEPRTREPRTRDTRTSKRQPRNSRQPRGE